MKEPSTSSFSHQFTYDVFISFRGEDQGEDLRHRFVGNLRHSLHRRGIKVFKDDDGDIRKGENITDTLMKAIQESQTAILVFSKHYATSSFCLRELVHIQKCIRGHNRAIWVVFYDVDPSDVRHQKNSYESAFQRYFNERDEKGERKYKEDEVKEWKVALKKAADICGWHWESSKCKMTTIGDPSGETSGSALEEQGQPSQQQKSTCVQSRCEYEHQFIESIEKEISRKISRVPFLVANHPVGLDTRVLNISSLLEDSSDDKVVFAGICGIGGLGKTTVARAVYNQIADQFEGLCFLHDIKEESRKYGVVKLQEMMLTEILGEDIRVGDANKGIPIIKRRLNRKKVLLILDNVDKKEQLDKLAGGYDWFGCGSKIIITTRDRHLLLTNGVERQKIYEMAKLNEEESLELLSWNAFKSKQVDPNFMDVSRCVITYAQGLPLAIEVIGSDLCHKSIEDWKAAIDTYRKISNKGIHEILKVSYDGLKEVEKDIFIDIACFYKGKPLGYVKDLVKYAHGFDDPSYAIGVLIDKCLISIDDWMRIEMHDLIQDMGREIVRQESPREPGKRSRLWFHEDIIHVLENDTGTNEVLVMVLEYMPKTIEVNWNGKAFKNMKNLKILILDKACFSKAPKYLPNSLRVLQWKGYPGSCLPDNFNPRKFVVLNLANSYIKTLGPMKRLNNVSVLNLSECKFVTRVPDISGIPILIELIVDSCENLFEIHDSVGFLNNLVTLSARNCVNLRAFPQSINLPYLENLDLSGCSSLKKFPEILGEMECVTWLDLSFTNLEVPFSIHNLVAHEVMYMFHGYGLKLSNGIAILPELKDESVEGCEVLPSPKRNEDQEEGNSMPISSVTTIIVQNCNILDEFFPICVSWFGNVMGLSLSGSNFTILPACINKLQLLDSLYLDDCKQLREIKGIPPYIEELMARNCTLLSSESRNIVMSKELHDKDANRTVCLPGSTIPECFHHRSRSPSFSFWYRNKFPQISLCFVLAPTDHYFRVQLIIIGDGKIKFSTTTCNQQCDLDEDHILFINVHLDIPLVSEWSHVEIFLSRESFNHPKIYRDWNHPKDRMILAKEVGLCLRNKDEIKEEDIKFTNPYKKANNNFRDKDMKSEEGTVVGRDHQFISNRELRYEIAKVAYHGELVDCEGVDRFVQLMQRLTGDWVSNLTGRQMLLDVIRYTEVEYYTFSIKGLPLLDKWLQDVLNGKFDDTERDKSVWRFLNASLVVLDRLPVSLSDLRTCNIVETMHCLHRLHPIAHRLLKKWEAENKWTKDEHYVRGRSIQ